MNLPIKNLMPLSTGSVTHGDWPSAVHKLFPNSSASPSTGTVVFQPPGRVGWGLPKVEVSGLPLIHTSAHVAPLRPLQSGLHDVPTAAVSNGLGNALPLAGAAMVGMTATQTLGWGAGAPALPTVSLFNSPGFQRFLGVATQVVKLHPVGRAVSLAVGGALFLSALRDKSVSPAAQFNTLPHEPKTSAPGYAVLPGAGDATILGGHTKEVPAVPGKEEVPAMDPKEVRQALSVPGRSISSDQGGPTLQGRPAQRWDEPTVLLSESAPRGGEKPFKYTVASHATTPRRYAAIEGEHAGQQFVVSHTLTDNELVQLPDGRMLMNTRGGLKPVPDGKYYFGSVRGRTGIAASIPDASNPARIWQSDNMHSAFDVTRGMSPELWGTLQIVDGKVTERINQGGTILPPSNDSLYVNRYPGDTSSGGAVWKLESLGMGKYELVASNGATQGPDGIYSFITRENGDIYVVKGDDAWHPDAVAGKPGRFAGEVVFGYPGYLDAWNDKTGHLMVSQYSAQQAGLPMARFRASDSTYDYNFGPAVNRWYAEAKPESGE